MTLKERDDCRKTLVQYYARLITVGASRTRARELTAAKARALGVTAIVNTVFDTLEEATR